MSDQIIFHHYPESPVSEKVRVVFGIKDLAWRSVHIPRVPPRPLLTPMTGGYRRTPVMQIGADIFCDSNCMLRELQRRHPEPTLYPGGADGMAWAVTRWIATGPFCDAIAIVLSNAAAEMEDELAADRGRLYFGNDYDYEGMAARTPEFAAQLRGQLQWIDERLAGGRRYMLGDDPGLPDAACYYLVWFIRGRWRDGPAFLKQFTHLIEWENRVANLSHGRPSDMSSEEALDIARATEPATRPQPDPDDPLGLEPGMMVHVQPDAQGDDPVVEGEIVAVSAHHVAIRRQDTNIGDVCIHFPRVGFCVRKL